MTNRQKVFLVLSIILSITIWGLFYGFIIGTAFTFSLLFHEYGHYHWMGREGINSKVMAMMPPFGAIAMAKEPWPSLGAEARIALAGPGFGLISAVVLFLIGVISASYEIRIATFAVCLVNLFNFWIPVAVLDGGRVFKPILFSFSTKLGFAFYTFSLIALFFMVGYFLSLFTLVLGFLILQILQGDRYAMWDTIISGKMVTMSGKEIVAVMAWFFLVSAGFLVIVLANGVRYADFISFITSN